MFAQFFSILAALTVVTALPSTPNSLNRRADTSSTDNPVAPIVLGVHFIEDHTKFVNKTNDKDLILGGSETAVKEFTWPGDLQGSNQIPFTWLIYDKSADQENLQPEDLRYSMTCKAQILEQHGPGKRYNVELNSAPPYVHLVDGTTGPDIVNKVNVICDEGDGCVDKITNCEGMEIPKFNQDNLNEFYKPKNT